MRPTKISEIIGQAKTKRALQIMIDSALIRNQPLPHNLFSGPAGTGKTTFAKAIAKEFGTRCIETNGSVITSTKSFYEFIKNIKYCDILFIDEIHAIKKSVWEWFLPVMEDFKYSWKRKNISIPKFTLIGATTESGTLIEPIRNRFKFCHAFQDYSLDELAEIVLLVFRKNGINIKNKKIARVIAKTCRGNPRHVVNRTEWIRDYMYSSGKSSISIEETLKAIEIAGFNKNGFTDNDIKYLKALIENGELGLDAVSTKCNIDINTVKNDIEPYLINLGIVVRGGRGRYVDGRKMKEYIQL